MLPQKIVPQSYDLFFKTNLKENTYKVNEKIVFSFNEESIKSPKPENVPECITIHGQFFSINKEATTLTIGGHSFKCQEIKQDDKLEAYSFCFGNEAIACWRAAYAKNPQVQAIFNTELDCCIRKTLEGFYMSRYEDLETNEKKVMFSTQFESTDARKAFLCVDEPNKKATFDLSFQIPKELDVIANTELQSEDLKEGNEKIVKFATTPKMSTYLVAWAIGDFEYIEDMAKYPYLDSATGEHKKAETRIRIYSMKGRKAQKRMGFALKTAVQCLEYFCEYFMVHYPLKKLDMVSIPGFSSGAMENWGLITYRENKLLLDTDDEQNATQATKMGMALTISHELSHSWFGNLVTMDWWNMLYLNEGFARFVEHFAIAEIHKDWNIWLNSFVSGVLPAAFGVDSLENSHALELSVEDTTTSAQIGTIFDSISYAKGGCVNRMLQDFMENDNFKAGVCSYLKEYSYRTAVSKNLFDHLSKYSDHLKPHFPNLVLDKNTSFVEAIMKPWIKEPGFPCISVKTVPNKELTDATTLQFSQSRYFSSHAAYENLEKKWKTVWNVPMRLVIFRKNLKGNSEFSKESKFFFLTEKSSNYKIENFDSERGDFLKVNSEQVGFYRVKYDDQKLLANLRHNLQEKYLSAADRLGILNDTFSQSRACLISAGDALELVDEISSHNEENCYVWRKIVESISAMSSNFPSTTENQEIRELFDSYGIKLLKHFLPALGWEKKVQNEDPEISILRNSVISFLLKAGDKETIAEAVKRYEAATKEFLSKENPDEFIFSESLLPTDLRFPILRAMVEHYSDVVEGAQKEMLNLQKFEELKNKIYPHVREPAQRNAICKALCFVGDKTEKERQEAQKLFHFFMDDEQVKFDEQAIFIYWMSIKHPQTTWKFVSENWDQLTKKYGEESHLTTFFAQIPGNLETYENAKEVEQFVEKLKKENKLFGRERIFGQSLETLRQTAYFVQTQKETILSVLRKLIKK